MSDEVISLNQIHLGELLGWRLEHAEFSATILRQGAQLLTFNPTGERNWLWLSESATYKRGKAVRGGIPLCWPMFGAFAANPSAVQDSLDPALPQHGVARIAEWTLTHLQAGNDKVAMCFALPDNVCDLQAEVRYVFTANSLSVMLTTVNTGDNPRTFTQALHTYLPTDDIHRSQIDGFDGIRYHDSLLEKDDVIQKGAITIAAETDRIYSAAPDIDFHTPSTHFHLQSRGSQSTVIWNPWRAKARAINQMQPQAYQRMLCIETANALNDAVSLAPNARHTLGVTIQRQTLDGT